MKILQEENIGRPTTVGEMVDFLSKIDRDMPIMNGFDSVFRLTKIIVAPDHEEVLDYTEWVIIEDID